jgi:hypothetical protein
MIETKRFSLVKPTVNTPVHIDFEWWKTHDNNWRIYLHSCLCTEHQASYSGLGDNAFIDWVDKDTAEVTSVDGLQHTLMTHCAKQPNFISTNTTLVDSVFRTFLANGNAPMSSLELSQQTGKSADTILRTLLGPTVYKGLRQFHQT